MSRNIVLLFDGTSNSVSRNRTNILRLYGMLEKSDRQLVYYDPGVGTMGHDGAWSGLVRKMAEIWGLATGWGLDANVKQAYRFLVENYRNPQGASEERDQIYIFGFSRGAYTARVLAGFINALGLIESRNLNLLDYAYRAFKRIGESGPDEAFAEIRLYERMLRPDRIPIRMLGLFDTVSSVIESGRFGPRLRSHAFTRTNPSVEAVAHALAIDEKRTMFRPQLWNEDQDYLGNPFNTKAAQPQDVSQVWFAGSHGDVGGGQSESESALAKVPLEWMTKKASDVGLVFNTRSVNALLLGKDGAHVPPDPLSEAHPSMTWGWSILEFVPRRTPEGSKRPALFGWTIPLFEPRTIPDGASIDASVTRRISAGGYDPRNLPPGGLQARA